MGIRKFCRLNRTFSAVAAICAAQFALAQNTTGTHAASPVDLPGLTPSMTAPVSRQGRGYVVAKDDVLNVDVVGAQELSRECRVDENGTITLPMLPHPVVSAGHTLGQLSQAIRNELLYAGLFTDPQVTVSVKSSTWNTVVLSGAARKPGVYPVYGRMTLLELLTQAEGLSDDAGSKANITRAGNPQQGPESNPSPTAIDSGAATSRTLAVDVWRLWQNGDPKLNVDLFPGDRVMIPRAGVVYVMGAVNRAGGFPLSNEDEQMTILKAVALAGNFSPHAKPADAVIIRKVPNAPGGRQEIRVNLKKVLSNQAPDRQLLANDVLYIPESGIKKALDGVASAAITTTIWRAPI